VGNASFIITHILKRNSLIWDGSSMLNFFLSNENVRKYFDELKLNVIYQFFILLKNYEETDQ